MRIPHFSHSKLPNASFESTFWIFFLLVQMSFFSCERTQYLPSLSTDEDPVISIIDPTTNSTLARPGQQVKVNILAVDDLALTAFRVKLKIVDDNGNIIEESTPVQQELSTLRFNYELVEIVSEQSASTQLIYTFEVIDSKGATSSAEFSIGVLPQQLPPQFRILSFKGQTLNSKLSGNNYALNFTSRATYPPPTNNALSRDIEENTIDNNAFQAKLISPNNAVLGQDSVFVITDESRFNFEETTWLSLSQAYFSGGNILIETPSLQVNDIVIVRLTKAPSPQFAVMKILEVIDETGTANDRLVFDYKVSSE